MAAAAAPIRRTLSGTAAVLVFSALWVVELGAGESGLSGAGVPAVAGAAPSVGALSDEVETELSEDSAETPSDEFALPETSVEAEGPFAATAPPGLSEASAELSATDGGSSRAIVLCVIGFSSEGGSACALGGAVDVPKGREVDFAPTGGVDARDDSAFAPVGGIEGRDDAAFAPRDELRDSAEAPVAEGRTLAGACAARGASDFPLPGAFTEGRTLDGALEGAVELRGGAEAFGAVELRAAEVGAAESREGEGAGEDAVGLVELGDAADEGTRSRGTVAAFGISTRAAAGSPQASSMSSVWGAMEEGPMDGGFDSLVMTAS